MKGSVYTTQKCRCGGRYVYDERRNGCFCECGQIATKGWYVVYGRDIQRRFSHDFSAAQRFLTGLRFKDDENTLDVRDYKSSNPMGFNNQVETWLQIKAKQVKRVSFVTYQGYGHRLVWESKH